MSRHKPGRGIYLLPNLITASSLLIGFFAAVRAFNGEFEVAAIALLVCVLLDSLDGNVARLTNTASRFGAEFDSLTDVVVFGCIPALIIYNWSLAAMAEFGWLWSKLGWLAAFFYTVATALRLARFNVSPERYRGRFDGLSSPGAAGMVISSVWFGSWLGEAGVAFSLPALLPGLGVALLGLLMVSPIPYVSFKGVNFWASYRRVVVVVLACVVIASKPQVTLFLLAIVYVVSGPCGWFWRRRTGRELEENPPPQALPPRPEFSRER